MAKIQRNFAKGRMNKAIDERLLPNGEYVDAVNVRLGSTEETEIGSVEVAKGNTRLTTVTFPQQPQYDGSGNLTVPVQGLSSQARCLGVYGDSSNETLYWFIHDPKWTGVYDASGSPSTVITSGTTTATLAGLLVDNTANFQADGVQVGDKVINTSLAANPHTFVSNITSSTQIELQNDLFVAGNNYQIVTNTQKIDLIVAYDTQEDVWRTLVASIYDGVPCTTGYSTTLNFNPNRLINGVNLIDDMLFFTDNYNPPRMINVTQTYGLPTITPPVAPAVIGTTSVDQFSPEEIMVIKAPPNNSPNINLDVSTNSEINYLEDKYICFATRFKYANNQYSAVSQFSDPAFEPGEFFISSDEFNNQGMLNKQNRVRVTFDTGSELVEEIEVLFKEADSSVIKVAEKINKAANNIGSNTTFEIIFDNSKIYQVLPVQEILRTFDNVPRVAKAQTIMGNRLMYGNYIENYNLINYANEPTRIQYTASGVSQNVGEIVVPRTYPTHTYPTIYGYALGTLSQSSIQLNFAGLNLIEGTTIKFSFQLGQQNAFDYTLSGVPLYNFSATGTTQFPTTQGLLNEATVNWSYTLPETFENAQALLLSPDFQSRLGAGIAADGGFATPGTANSVENPTLTDAINAAFAPTISVTTATAAGLPTNSAGNTSNMVKYVSGHSSNIAVGSASPQTEPILYTSPSENEIKLVLNAMIYIPSIQSPTSGETNNAMSVPFFVTSKITITDPNGQKSLHSNRGYEVGMIYMDKFNRATPPLLTDTFTTTDINSTVSTTASTVHFSCDNSSTVNKIRVTIPPTQFAPKWATHYKFALKPTKDTYNTIYSSKSFKDPLDGSYYFLLEGENALKVETGDQLIVKKDALGATDSCEVVQVLSKGAKEKNFIDVNLEPGTAEEVIAGTPNVGAEDYVPQGVYMQLKNFPFALTQDQNVPYPVNNYNLTQFAFTSSSSMTNAQINNNEDFPILAYQGLSGAPSLDVNGDTVFTPFAIPQGTAVRIFYSTKRKGDDSNSGQGKLKYKYDQSFVADATYDNFIEFFNGMNIGATLNSGVTIGSACNGFVTNTYIETPATNTTDPDVIFGPEGFDNCQNVLRFVQNTNTGEILLYIRGGGGNSIQLRVKARIEIALPTVGTVFETLAADANPELWYEGSDSYTINTANGSHNGIVANGDISQVTNASSAGTTGVINLQFFNCFTFGNGVESYKIEDKLNGKTFNLGNRAVTTTEEDYRQNHRPSDITYSGVFNDESGLNNLNEFNLGLVNFKSLEESFGAIQVMDSRETDVLVLQEDKISYVLQGKNLLSDAAGGGDIASVPEVLGTQIARTEQYGISNNPESYVQYGLDKFFIDEKRGAVLRLTGQDTSAEKLTVISELGLRSFFRDVFNGQGPSKLVGAPPNSSMGAATPSSITPFTQKLGAYDPYMNEYVISINDRPLVITSTDECETTSEIDDELDLPIFDCGSDVTFQNTNASTATQSAEIAIGDFEPTATSAPTGQIIWDVVVIGGSATVSVLWDGAVVATQLCTVASNGTVANQIDWEKTSVSPANCIVQVTPSAANTSVSFTANCPLLAPLNIDTVIYTSNYPLGVSSAIDIDNTGSWANAANFGVGSGPDEGINYTATWQWSNPGGEVGVQQNFANTIESGVSSNINNGSEYNTTSDNTEYPFVPRIGGWNDTTYQNQSPGQGAPPPGSNIEINFVPSLVANAQPVVMFNPEIHTFRILRTSTNFNKNSQADAVALLAASTAIPKANIEYWDEDLEAWQPATGWDATKLATAWKATTTMPSPVGTQNEFYMVIDVRSRVSTLLCQTLAASNGGANGTANIFDTCCDCDCGAGNPTCYSIINSSSGCNYTFQYTDTGGAVQSITVGPAEISENGVVFDSGCVQVCSLSEPVLTAINAIPFPIQDLNSVPAGCTSSSSNINVIVQSCGSGGACTDCATGPCT